MSSAVRDKKLKEAEENIKLAEKHLNKKSLFRWSPDYLAAAPYLGKAADCYRVGQNYEQAKKTYVQLANIQDKNKSSFRAAQASENAAKMSIELLNERRITSNSDNARSLISEAMGSYRDASGYYTDMGEFGKAADALVKGAVILEERGGDVGIDQAKDLYMESCSLMETQGKPHFAVDIFRKTVAFLVKNSKYREALSIITRQIAIFQSIGQENNIHKCYLSEIILFLILQDVAAADKRYMEQLQMDSYLSADESALAEDLLRAFKSGNEDDLQTTVRKQGFSFLDSQIGRLVRKLSIYGEGRPRPAQKVSASQPSNTQNIPVIASDAPFSEFAVSDSIENPGTDLDFDFDGLEFSMEEDAANKHIAPSASSAAPASPVSQQTNIVSPQQNKSAEDDMFDLT